MCESDSVDLVVAKSDSILFWSLACTDVYPGAWRALPSPLTHCRNLVAMVTGMHGNLTSNTLSVIVSMLLSILTILAYVFFLQFQTYV